MICDRCSKLALFPVHHGCINCPRFCSYKEQKFCDYCSSIKNICSVCGRSMKDIKAQDINEQINKVHPFYGSVGGCRTCGGGR